MQSVNYFKAKEEFEKYKGCRLIVLYLDDTYRLNQFMQYSVEVL